MYTLHLLGGASLEGPAGPLSGPAVQPGRLALLVLLAVPASRAVPRDKLVALLWPERSASRGRRSLSDSLYVLRQALGEEAIRSVGDALRLDPGHVHTDVATFRRALDTGAPEEAVEAYRGPLLDGVHLRDSVAFERWVDRQRGRLADEYVQALRSLARTAGDRGDLEEALSWRRRVVAERPYSTAAVLALMRTLERSGNPAGAVRAAHLHQERLSRDLRAEPDPTLLEELDRIRTAPAAGGTPAEGPGRTRDRGSGAGTAVDDPPFSDGRPPPRRVLLAMLALAAVLSVSYLGVRGGGVLGTEPTDGIRSIAVLPFESRAPDPADQAWFAHGMTEAVTTELGRIEELNVISWTSARQFAGVDRPLPEIARQLGVDALVEGSVLREEDAVRISLQLVDGRTDRRLWGRSYERELRDVVGLQAEVAAAIAGEIEVTASPALRDRDHLAGRSRGAVEADPRAYEAYLHGRYHFDRWGSAEFEKAMRRYREAIAIDSTFAPAHAALADVCLRPSIYNVHMSLDECRASALRAIGLDPRSAEAHAALGRVRTRQWDWKGAETAFRRALQLNPNSGLAHRWYAILLGTTMRRDQALEHIRRAEELDPLNLLVKTIVAVQLARLGRTGEADAQLDEVLEMDPEYVLAHLVSATMGRPDEAAAHARYAVSQLGHDPLRPRLVTAVVQARHGDTARARELLQGVEEELAGRPEEPLGFVAIVHYELGHIEEALDWLEEAVEVHSMSVASITSDRTFDDLRSHPRFRALRRRMGLP